MRALAVIVPSLYKAYGQIDPNSICLSSGLLADRREGDLISLGGAKNNEVTADLLKCLGTEWGGVPQQDGSTITFDLDGVSTRVEAETENNEVVDDYGLIVRCDSPYATERRVVILAGASTFGTTAAARHFVANCKSVKGNFAAVVKARVRDGHVLEPHLISMEKLVRRTDASR